MAAARRAERPIDCSRGRPMHCSHPAPSRAMVSAATESSQSSFSDHCDALQDRALTISWRSRSPRAPVTVDGLSWLEAGSATSNFHHLVVEARVLRRRPGLVLPLLGNHPRRRRDRHRRAVPPLTPNYPYPCAPSPQAGGRPPVPTRRAARPGRICRLCPEVTGKPAARDPLHSRQLHSSRARARAAWRTRWSRSARSLPGGSA